MHTFCVSSWLSRAEQPSKVSNCACHEDNFRGHIGGQRRSHSKWDPPFFQTKGTFFLKKRKPTGWSASKWPVFICYTHQGARRGMRRSFCQLLFAPRPKSNRVSNGSWSCACSYFPKGFILPPPWKSGDRVTASVSRPRTEMNILVETFPSCLNWVRGGAIKQHSF